MNKLGLTKTRDGQTNPVRPVTYRRLRDRNRNRLGRPDSDQLRPGQGFGWFSGTD